MHPIKLLRTASFRLTALYAVLFSAFALALFAATYLIATNYMARQLDASIAAQVADLVGDPATEDLAQLAALVRQREETPGTREFYYLLENASGRRMAGNLPSIEPRRGWLDLPMPNVSSDDAEQGHAIRAFGERLSGGAFLLVALDTYRLGEVSELMARVFAWSLAVAFLLALAGGVVVSSGFLRRVDAINRAADEIVGGNLSRRIPIKGSGDDFDRLSANLNGMLDRIQALMEDVRQLSNDIAHDLRTPLARLRQRLEGARGAARSIGDYEKAVEQAIIETDAVLDTFSALLRIAQIESGSRRSGFARVDLSAVTHNVVDTYLAVAEDQRQVLRYDIAPHVHVHGDRELLTQMLANLVENALRHTSAGSIIDVSLSASNASHGPSLAVSDNGPGIPATERDKVFRRFYRLDSSRATPGTGLGLSLVAAVAGLHGASVALEDNAPGLEIIVRFAQ